MTATARLALFAVALALPVGCAHVKVQPIVITGHMLDAAGMTYESVTAGMKAASDRGALTREQVLAWNDFIVRWDAGYRLAAKSWKEARTKLDQPAAEQATEMLVGLLSELATFQLITQGAL